MRIFFALKNRATRKWGKTSRRQTPLSASGARPDYIEKPNREQGGNRQIGAGSGVQTLAFQGGIERQQRFFQRRRVRLSGERFVMLRGLGPHGFGRLGGGLAEGVGIGETRREG